MSDPKIKPNEIDYAIGELEMVRQKVIKLACQIDNSLKFLDRCKEIKLKKGKNGN